MLTRYLGQRAVVEASWIWRMDKSDLVFSDGSDEPKGASACIAKATAPGLDFDDSENGDSNISESIAVKKFKLDDDVDRYGHQVAVGVLHSDLGLCPSLIPKFQAFANELSILSELRDENIVEFIGFVENVEERVAWILLRWADNGNLQEFIQLQEWSIPERLSLVRFLLYEEREASITS